MLLNDGKMVELVTAYNDAPASVDCMVYGTINGGVLGIDPALLGNEVQIDGEVDNTAEQVVSGVSKVVGGLSSIFSALGTAADALDTATDEMTNDAAIITVTNEIISCYIFNKSGSKISCKMDIPFNQIDCVKRRKMLLWHTITCCFARGQEINLSITGKVAGIKKQKENIEKFTRLLEAI